eukprot:TRINITY_DN242_c0_g1_i4.p1 TRINITY_DN242_c0_g1~~TRINITY_DN242_c0_g1_i4.p1  ORF type:complete len:501 (+),score=156.77 TRINITY_DN242_c0_g1_i4:65-1567(+)
MCIRDRGQTSLLIPYTHTLIDSMSSTASSNEKQGNYVEAKADMEKLFNDIMKSEIPTIKANIDALYNKLKAKDADFERRSIFNDFKEGKGRTVVHFAASRGNVQVFQYVLDEGGDYKTQDEGGNDALFVATQHGNLAIVKFLIEDKKVDYQRVREGDTTILHVAAGEDDVHLLDYLIGKFQGKIDIPSGLGSPLEWAVSNGKTKNAQLLLEKGANPNGNDFSKKQVPTPLIMTIYLGASEIFSLLVKHGANINGPDSAGWTPLQCAAECGNIDVVKFLLEKGADPNVETQSKTALDLAFEHDRWDVVTLLRPLTKKTIDGDAKRERTVEKPKAQTVDKEKAQQYKAEGNEYFKNNNLGAAVEAYTKSIEADDTDAVLYTNRATVLLKMEDFAGALKDSQIAKALNPDWLKGYFREGEAYLGLKEYGEAAASFFEGLNRDPENHEFKKMFDHCVKIGREHYQKTKGDNNQQAQSSFCLSCSSVLIRSRLTHVIECCRLVRV